MPVAVITEQSKTFELKTCPPDGFVTVRRMSYGQKLTRTEMTSKLRIATQKGTKEFQGEIDMMQRQVTLWEFANLIADHNLTDASGRKLNFSSPADVQSLMGQVGEEISTYIDELNNFELDMTDGTTELGN
jgi:hypothetical protein